jgi:hypothetical protein
MRLWRAWRISASGFVEHDGALQFPVVSVPSQVHNIEGRGAWLLPTSPTCWILAAVYRWHDCRCLQGGREECDDGDRRA